MENTKVNIELISEYLKKQDISKLKNKDDFVEFITNLKDYTPNQIINIIKDNPKFANLEVEKSGLHALHYLAMLNNHNVINVGIAYAVKDGLTNFPVNKKQFLSVPKNSNFMNFCIINDLNESFANCFLWMSKDYVNKELKFESYFDFVMCYDAFKIKEFILNLIDSEKLKNLHLDFFKSDFSNNYIKTKFSKHFKKASSLGFDLSFKYKKENGEDINYLDAYLFKIEKSYDRIYPIFKNYDYNSSSMKSEEDKNNIMLILNDINENIKTLISVYGCQWGQKQEERYDNFYKFIDSCYEIQKSNDISFKELELLSMKNMISKEVSVKKINKNKI